VDSESREARLRTAFVALADTLVSEFDLLDLLHTLIDACTDILDSDAAGLMLSDANGDLQLMASSTEEIDSIEVVQLGAEAGPCWQCFKTGRPVTIGDIEQDAGQWPDFQRVALAQGYRSIHATPMRLRGQVIGTMNLLHTELGELNDRDIALAQSLTDVATIGILQERGSRQLRDLSSQLQGALDSRIIVEQAKGVLAQSLNVSLDEAFRMLRSHARSTNQTLQLVATDVVARRGTLTPSGDNRGASTEADRRRRPRAEP
jgi:GAF domain-containing protein